MTNPPDTSPTLRRRHLLTGSVAATAAGLAGTPTTQAVPHSTPVAGRNISHGILQPHTGPIVGDIYLPSVSDEVTWGYVPTVHATPTARVRSGRTILIDALSHEGLLEDQGRDPISWFGEHGVRRHHVLADAIDVAARYDRHRRDFDADGPHVVTGPVFVEGAEPGDVLKIETLDLRTRVPYGVVSSRHGEGTLAITPNGTPPAGISLAEVMPPHATDGRATHDPTGYGNVSVFADIVDGRARMRAGRRHVHFPLQLFFGMMGVARSEAATLNDPSAHSVPPTPRWRQHRHPPPRPGQHLLPARGGRGRPVLRRRPAPRDGLGRGGTHCDGGFPARHLPPVGLQEGVWGCPVGRLPPPLRRDPRRVDPDRPQ